MYNIKNLTNNNIFLIVCLFFILIFSHFIPFERLSIAPDDFYFLEIEKIGMKQFINNPDRPLEFLWHEMQYYLIGSNYNISFYILILTNFILVLLSFILFRILAFDKKTSFLFSIIYILLFYKIEIYHTFIFAWINFADSIYILSIIFFILSQKKNNTSLFFLSLLFYTIGLLFRESGFFIPLVLFVCLFIFNNNNYINKFKFSLIFIFIMFFNFIYRISGAFGNTPNIGREISIYNIPSGIIDIFHTFFGRYFIKNIVYGIYQFTHINLFWIIIIIIINIFILVFLFNFIKNYNFIKINNKNFIFFIVLFVCTLLPNLIAGSIGGRNLIIPSISIVIFIYWFLSYFKLKNKILTNILIFFMLIVCQGNAWSHVISCRINYSIYNYISENKDIISSKSIIVIDTKSFAEKIPHSFINNDHNVLNAYYGSQTFESWGLESMIRIALGEKKALSNKKIYISTGYISNDDDKVYIKISKKIGYNKIKNININLDLNELFLITFEDVYNKGFKDGKRK